MIYNNIRRKTNELTIGKVKIGGNHPIAIQSMTNVDTLDTEKLINQLQELQNAGCQIARITVPSQEAADSIFAIRKAGIVMPIVADIHFDYKIAIKCAEIGFDKIRINPGNIGDDTKVKEVVDACRAKNIPIRIGVNSGSLEKHILAKYGAPTAEALVESGLYHIGLLEKFNYHNIAISIKASNVENMIRANRLLASKCSYPIHLGVTEAGGGNRGLLKSAIGIGSLLNDGIGDTIRVSLTDNPVEEISAAKQILQTMEIQGQCGMDIVSCPTCGRTKIDLIHLVKEFEIEVKKRGLDSLPMKVALMGCVVNGPGEASEADIGIAGGKGEAVLFKNGKIIEKISENDVIQRLIQEIEKMKG